MTTLLEKRQAATVKNLLKRKDAATRHIEHQTAKLEEKLAPYRTELALVEKMLGEYQATNPELPIQPPAGEAA